MGIKGCDLMRGDYGIDLNVLESEGVGGGVSASLAVFARSQKEEESYLGEICDFLLIWSSALSSFIETM